MTNHVQLAALVLAKACVADSRINPTSATRDFWAEAFADATTGVWQTEALKAVTAHYSKPNPFPIFPGDVIEFCAKQPIHSSPEHVRFHLDKLCERYAVTAAGQIEELTGLRYDELLADFPREITPADERRVLEERLRAWVAEREPELVSAAMTRKVESNRAIGR